MGVVIKELPQTINALTDVAAERVAQHEVWGTQRLSWHEWIGILGEEFGEATQAANAVLWSGADISRLRHELIQTAAVAVQIIEHIDEIVRGVGDGCQEITPGD
jgi:hypothetical protein